MKRALQRIVWFVGGCFTAYGVTLIVAGTFAWKLGEAISNFWEEV